MPHLGIELNGPGARSYLKSQNGGNYINLAGKVPADLMAGDYIIVIHFRRNSNSSVFVGQGAGSAGGQTWTNETTLRQAGVGSSVLSHCRYNGGSLATLEGTEFGISGGSEGQLLFIEYLRNTAKTGITFADGALDSDDGGAGAAAASPFTRAAEVTTAPLCLNQIVHFTGGLNTFSNPSAGWTIRDQAAVDMGTTDYSICVLEQVTLTASDPGNVSVTPNASVARISHAFAIRPALLWARQPPMIPLLSH